MGTAVWTPEQELEATRREYEWRGEQVQRAIDTIRGHEDAIVAARERLAQADRDAEIALRDYNEARVAVGEDPLEGY